MKNKRQLTDLSKNSLSLVNLGVTIKNQYSLSRIERFKKRPTRANLRIGYSWQHERIARSNL